MASYNGIVHPRQAYNISSLVMLLFHTPFFAAVIFNSRDCVYRGWAGGSGVLDTNSNSVPSINDID